VVKVKVSKLDKRRDSGQVILIAVLAMALILLSAQVYVFEVQMSTIDFDSNLFSDYVYAIKLGSQNAVLGSLANISNGGVNSVLASNLNRLVTLVNGQNQFGRSTLNYTLEESAAYSSGIWLFWGTNGFGVSSAAVHFTFNLSDREVDFHSSYSVNVTTTLMAEGTFKALFNDEKQVNVTLNLLNEGNPALANQITIYYRVSGSWLAPNASNNYVLTDYGNGTYLASFNADIPSQTVEVSVYTKDRRQIFVQTNATCSQV
jgi:hypothetical protein